MSDAKHTSGPWKARKRGAGYLNRESWCVDCSDDQEEVAEFVDGEANAKLIAQAPEMLRLLKEVKRSLDSEEEDWEALYSISSEIGRLIEDAT